MQLAEGCNVTVMIEIEPATLRLGVRFATIGPSRLSLLLLVILLLLMLYDM